MPSPVKINKTFIYIAVGVLLFLIALGWYFYRQGKKKVTLQYLPGDLPGNPGSGNQSGASNDEIKNIATNLYNDMKGLNVLGHKDAPYQSANILNDADIIKLYNAYNSFYQSDSGETLTSWLNNERFTSDEQGGKILLARLKKLNCL